MQLYETADFYAEVLGLMRALDQAQAAAVEKRPSPIWPLLLCCISRVRSLASENKGAIKSTMSTTAQVLETSRKSREWILWPGVLLGLTVILYAPVLKSLVQNWWSNPDYGHGFFVPLFSGYILWHERERWTKTEIKPSNFGFVVMLGAVGLLLLGSLGAELFTSRFSLVVMLTGMILFLAFRVCCQP